MHNRFVGIKPDVGVDITALYFSTNSSSNRLLKGNLLAHITEKSDISMTEFIAQMTPWPHFLFS